MYSFIFFLHLGALGHAKDKSTIVFVEMSFNTQKDWQRLKAQEPKGPVGFVLITNWGVTRGRSKTTWTR